ncbi:NUDIX hydrolase [Kitasatospora sp. NPDC056076]|uniref:NUDIX hydrolase n=1 Tax=Kitasatospora sp. NPDC056076 TaxID=3345703 RepID=UPI0035DC34A9
MVGPGELVERVDEHDRVLGVVERGEAIRRGWLHRVATTVCRDPSGRVLVHRRPDGAGRFGGCHDVMLGGALRVGESYAAGARRELAEELGVSVPVRHRFTFLCRGAIAPYWLGVHEAVLPPDLIDPDAVDPAAIARYGWLTLPELAGAVRRWPFVPDGQVAFRRYLLGLPSGAGGVDHGGVGAEPGPG